LTSLELKVYFLPGLLVPGLSWTLSTVVVLLHVHACLNVQTGGNMQKEIHKKWKFFMLEKQ